MRGYQCDYCKATKTGEPAVALRGVIGRGGGILLPEAMHERTFCGPPCFWGWADQWVPYRKAVSKAAA